MTQTILVVDDEPRIVNLVRGYLEQDGYRVVTAGDGRTALLVAREEKPNLIVLDLMMPEMDGWAFLRHLRQTASTPVIMLTARIDDVDKIAGLEMGADDYVSKPFNARELVARVRAVLRRADPRETVDAQLNAGDLRLNPTARTVHRDGAPVSLTRMEFDILETLLRHPGRAFTRLELLEQTQGYAYDGYERTIDVHIKNLRRKLEADTSNPLYILTVFGIGYRLNGDL